MTYSDEGLRQELAFFKAVDAQRAGAIFMVAWDETADSIEYNPTWKMANGIFSGAVYDPLVHQLLPLGSKLRCPGVGRRALLVGTDFGTVIVFNNGESFSVNMPELVMATALFTADSNTMADRIDLLLNKTADLNAAAVLLALEQIALKAE